MAEAFTRWTRSEEQGLCPNVKNPTFNVGMVFFSDLSTEYSFEDTIANENYDLEKIVETKMLIDRVREAIDSLNDEEREVIERLYYQDESTRIAAKALNLHKTSLIRKRDRILAKLKKMLEGNI